jgi:DtxR family Mn-dependent transcriptional regulator
VHVHQRRPSFVVKVGETDVALDVALARDIYVKQIS